MAISSYSGANINSTTGTFSQWLAQHNEIVYDLSTVIVSVAGVTVANATNGSQTTGNGDIVGILSANTLVAKDFLRGGQNDEFGNSAALNIASNTIIGNSTTADTLTVWGDGVFNQNVTIGSSSSDEVIFNAEVASDIDPDGDSTRDLGSTSNRWNALYVDAIYANSTLQMVANTPTIILDDLDTDGALGPIVTLRRTSGSSANNDNIGAIDWTGQSDANTYVDYARVFTRIGDNTDGAEHGQLSIQTVVAGTTRTVFDVNNSGGGSTRLYFANSSGSDVKLQTYEWGLDVTGELQSDTLDVDGVADIVGITSLHANTEWDDNARLRIGTGGDLEIWHDGTNSYIRDNGTGNLNIQTGSTANPVNIGNTTSNFGEFDNDYVNFYGSGVLVANIRSTGVVISSNVTAQDNLTITGDGDFNGNVDLGATTTDGISFIGRADTDLVPIADGTYDLGATSLRWALGYFDDVHVTSNVNANNFIATSQNRPALILDSVTSGNTWTEQGALIAIGEGASTQTAASLLLTYQGNGRGMIGMGGHTDGHIDGASFEFIYNSNNIIATGNLYPSTDSSWDFGSATYCWSTIWSDNANISADVTVGGNVAITGNTTMTGRLAVDDAVTVTANLQIDSDSGYLMFGADNDARFLHNGSHLCMYNDTGNWYIRNRASGQAISLQANVDGTNRTLGTFDGTTGEVNLYYANSTASDIRFETRDFGTYTNGEIRSTTANVAGAANVGGTLNAEGNFTVNGTVFQVTAATGAFSAQGTGSITGAATLANTLGVTGAATFSNTGSFAGDVTITSTTQSTSVGSGALTVDGGVGIDKDLFVGGNTDIAGDLQVDGDLNVTGSFALPANTVLTVNTSTAAQINVTSILNVTGNTDLGNAVSDSVTFVAKVDSNIVPFTDSTYTLGNTTFQWAEAHIDAGYIDDITATTLAVSGVSEFTANTEWDDDDRLIIGTGRDFQLYHNGTNTFLQNSTGDLFIRNLSADDDLFIQTSNSTGGAEPAFYANGTSTRIYGGGILGATLTGSAVDFAVQVNFNGDVNLGNDTSDTITFTGRADSDLVPSTTNARDLGSASLYWAQAHSGITYAYSRAEAAEIRLPARGETRMFDSGNTGYVALRAPETVTTNTVYSLPANDGTSGQALVTDGSGNMSWSTFTTAVTLKGDSGTGGGSSNVAILGGTGVTTVGSSNATHDIATISVGQAVGTGDSPTFGGLTLNGVATLNANVDLQDSDYIKIGSADDLQIHHDGTHSYIRDTGTGSLYIQTSSAGTPVYVGNTTANYAEFDNDFVNLRAGGSLVANVRSGVFAVTGELRATSANIATALITGDLEITDATPTFILTDTNATTNAEFNGLVEYRNSGGSRIGWVGFGSSVNEDLKIANETTSGSVVIETNDTSRWTFNSDGDLVSSGSIAIGNSSQSVATIYADNIIGTANVATYVTVSDSTDTTSFIAMFDSATGNLLPRTDGGLTYNSSTGSLTSTALSWGSGQLTGTSNVSVTGSGGAIHLTDDSGTSSSGPGVFLYNRPDGAAGPADGNWAGTIRFHSYNDATGNTTTHRYAMIYAQAEDVTDGSEDGSLRIQTTVAGSQRVLAAFNVSGNNGAAQLYYANSTGTDVKLVTTSDGINVVGEIQGDSLDVDGSGDISGSVAFGNTITVSGNATFSNTLSVTGNATFSNTVNVTGNATFANVVSFNGSTTNISGTLNLTGALNASGISPTFDGLTSLSNITNFGQLSTTGIAEFSSNVSLTTTGQRLKIGASDEVQMYTDGTDGYFVSTGNVEYQTSDSSFHRFGNTTTAWASIGKNSHLFAVNGSTVAQVLTGRVSVTGNVDATSHVTAANVVATSYITGANVQATSTLIGANLDINGPANISGQLTLSSNVHLQDNDTLEIGTGSDLQVYHNGTDSYIDVATGGDLFVRNNVAGGSIRIQIRDDDGSTLRNSIVANSNHIDLITSNNTATATTLEVDFEDGVTVTGDFSVSSDATVTGNVTATGFSGNGAGLTSVQSDFELIETIEASGLSNVDFTSLSTGEYKYYKIIIDDLQVNTGDDDIVARVSTDGGSTWETANGNYNFTVAVAETVFVAAHTASAAGPRMYLTHPTANYGVGDQPDEGFSAELMLSRVESGGRTRLYGTATWEREQDDVQFRQFVGTVSNITTFTTAVNAIQFSTATGSTYTTAVDGGGFSGGRISIYGIRG